MDHSWFDTQAHGYIPPNAIVAGRDSDDDPIYLGRARYNGDLLPAKVIPRKHQAYVAWGGQEINVTDIQVLCGHDYEWEHASGGRVPPHALRIGQTSDGEPLYIGRGHYHNSLTPGKVQPSHGCLYIPYGGTEHRLDNYEVLVQPARWVHAHGSELIPGTVHAGRDADGDDIYVGRAHHEGDELPAKVIPNKNCAYVSWGGEEHKKYEFELLVGYGFGWVDSHDGHVPHGAFPCGRTNDGEVLYIGRGHYNGSHTPGKIHPSHQCLYIPFGGREVRLSHYEVLVKS